MKETMLRAFSWVDADILKNSSRPEWPVFLHNLCFIHGAVKLRARLGRAGWNCHKDLLQIGNNELFVRGLFFCTDNTSACIVHYQYAVYLTAPTFLIVAHSGFI